MLFRYAKTDKIEIQVNEYCALMHSIMNKILHADNLIQRISFVFSLSLFGISPR